MINRYAGYIPIVFILPTFPYGCPDIFIFANNIVT